MNTRKTILESDLDQIDHFEKFPEEYFTFQLGVALQYEYSPPGIKYSASYPEMGNKLWKAFRNELYDILCDNKTQEPKEWLNDLITGDIRNLVTGIVSTITATYDVSIAIALPVTALIIKNGLLNYCSNSPKKTENSVSQILNETKQTFQ